MDDRKLYDKLKPNTGKRQIGNRKLTDDTTFIDNMKFIDDGGRNDGRNLQLIDDRTIKSKNLNDDRIKATGSGQGGAGMVEQGAQVTICRPVPSSRSTYGITNLGCLQCATP